MLKNDFVRSRIMQIEPIATESCGRKQTADVLDYLFDKLYIFANLTIANAFEEYQGKKPEEIPYLKGAEKVKQIETTIQQWRNTAAGCTDIGEKEKWNKKIERLVEIKRHYRRHHLKKIFAAECRVHPYLKNLETRFPQIPPVIAFNTFFEVRQNFLHDWLHVLEGTRRLRSYSKGMPFYFGYDYNFTPFYIHKNENGKEQIRFKWIATNPEIHFAIEFGRDKSENEELLRNEIIGNKEGYKKLGDSFIQLDRKRNKIFLTQVFKLEQPSKQKREIVLNPSLVMGVDLGVKIPLCWALSNKSETGEIGSIHKIQHLRNQYVSRINRIQADLKKSGAEGKGQAGRLKPLSKIRKSERELIKQINRDMAKELVDLAVQKGAGTIHLEDIDFTEKKNLYAAGRLLLNENLAYDGIIKEYKSYYDRMFTMFRNWSYGQLIRFIKEQSEEKGIQVLFVDPRQSSRKCFACMESGQRNKQEYLEVKKKQECNVSYCPCDKAKTKTLKNRKDNSTSGYIYFIPADNNAAFNIACNAKLTVPAEKQPVDWPTVIKKSYDEMITKKEAEANNKNNYRKFNPKQSARGRYYNK